MPTPLPKPWPSGPVVLGMPGRATAELAELLDVVEREVVAGEIEQAVEEHRAVAGR
jgi:hypothetical protein